MLNRMVTWVLTGVGVVAGVYGVLLLALYLLQGSLLFLPSQVSPEVVTNMAVENGAIAHQIQSQDGTRLQVWHYPSNGDRIVLYAHGNAGSLADHFH